MNIKHKQIFSVVFLTSLIICIFFSVNVKAQDYTLQLKANDEYVWEVTALNKDKFEYTFNAEPNFDIGDQKKIVIREISSFDVRWAIVVAFWDFGTDWSVDGDIQYLNIYTHALEYDDFLFVPTPVDDYFEAALSGLPSEYSAGETPFSIVRQARSDIDRYYRVVKTFDIRGVITSETFYDEGDSVIVKMEGTFLLVPLGFSFIGFMVVAIISILAIFLKKNKIRFS